jgi:pyridoxamine 5'-phosphate oxidase
MADPEVLDPATAPADPLELFSRWYGEALAAGHPESDAMALATAEASGRPSVRMVLLKDHGPGGFVFYTNGRSRKGREMASNPRAALLLYWAAPLHRQVRIEGPVGPLAAAESDAYFASRPRGARLGALASPQSEPIGNREELETRVRDLDRRHPGSVPRPEHWGGWRVIPESIEFWLGRPDRLHDRVRYTRTADAWRRERLAP